MLPFYPLPVVFLSKFLITSHVISILELPLHLARPPAICSVCSSPSSASSPPSLSMHHPHPHYPCYYHHHHLHHHSQFDHYHHHHCLLHANNELSSFYRHRQHQHQYHHNYNSWSLPSLSLSLSPLRKSVSCNYCCEYNSISLQTALMIFITLLFNVILNFQLTKIILGFNIFSIFILFILIYAKFYTKFSLNLTYNITQHKCFLLWLFNCFYLCQVFKIAWIINPTDSTFSLKFLIFIILFCIKCLQLPRLKVKCYIYFISLEFCEHIR